MENEVKTSFFDTNDKTKNRSTLNLTIDRKITLNRIADNLGIDPESYNEAELFDEILKAADGKSKPKIVSNPEDLKEVSSLQQKVNLLHLKVSQLEQVNQNLEHELKESETKSKCFPDDSIIIKLSEFTKGLLTGYLKNKGFISGLKLASKTETIKIKPFSENIESDENLSALLINTFVYSALGYKMETLYNEEKLINLYKKFGSCL
jgi:hypothetical protein